MGTPPPPYIIYECERKRKIFGEEVEEKPPCSPLRGLMQTLSIKNKRHRYLTKPVALAVIAYETGGSARSRNTCGILLLRI